MFKNKTVQMKIIKDPKSDQFALPPRPPVNYARIARDTTQDVVKGTAMLISTYVAADTLRRIAVHIVATKIK